VQEIHIALWRETKYVLLRFNRQGRMRMHQMKGVVQQLHDKFQIVSNEILGYDAITENTRENDDAGGGIKEHPGFKHIVDELKKKKGHHSLMARGRRRTCLAVEKKGSVLSPTGCRGRRHRAHAKG
jgi:hypothetical protein